MSVIRIQRKLRLRAVLGLAVIVACVAFILFSGGRGITRADVNLALNRFAAYISTEASSDGKTARFTYGDVALSGFYARHAVVSDVHLDVSDPPPASANHWSITTPRMLVSTNSAAPGGIVFTFPDPVDISENGQPKVTLAFPSPLTYSYADTTMRGTHVIQHLLILPPRLVVTPTGGKPVLVAYDGTPEIRVDMFPEAHERDAAYDFRNVSITTSEGTAASASAISSRLNEKPGASGHVQGSYVLMVTDLALRDRNRATHPYSMSVNVSYDKTPPQADDVTVNEFVLASSDFKLRLAGKFATVPDDHLPFGVGNLMIDGIPKFLNSELVPVSVRQPLALAIDKAVGHAASNHADIVLRREKGGVFYVGDVTFQSLAASMLADLLTPQRPSVPVVTAPAPAKPSAPPVPAKPAAPAAAPVSAGAPSPVVLPEIAVPAAPPPSPKGK